jgi:5-methylcytosine-specific restriction endonuclease McrA
MPGHPYYQTPHWKALRSTVIKRDKWRCQQCGSGVRGHKMKEPRPVVDHIKPRPKHNGPTGADTLDNLVTLCLPCHNRKTQHVDQSKVTTITGADGFPCD